MSEVLKRRMRCAVYTRKSTDEGLDQEYNSIDAQRDAGHAYIASQRAEGWIPVADDYDDPAFSGGNMERPALRRMMADIEAGKIDVVVIYKIDRLTRSLADFSKMVEVFERYGVSFVSVTQQFNTTTSMGRLMLNILLSFAQFEREVTGERIRDKIAASKRKGMWMGGVPPLGYDVENRRLVPNEREAKLIRHIFQRFVELGSSTALVKELKLDGVTSKAWTTQDGKTRDGRPIDKGHIYKLLSNRTYLGELRHKDQWYQAEHPPIISRELWDSVHAILATNGRVRGNATRARFRICSRASCSATMVAHCRRGTRPRRMAVATVTTCPSATPRSTRAPRACRDCRPQNSNRRCSTNCARSCVPRICSATCCRRRSSSIQPWTRPRSPWP
jgi:site-specific DNA recombinase